MSIRRQDIIVLLVYYLGYSRIINLILRLKRKPISRFVTFHDLLDEEVEYFETKMRFLKESTNVVSLDDYFSGKLSCKKLNVVITFDDGYRSWVTDAIPIMEKLKLPATFFVSSGFIGLSYWEEAEYIQSNLMRKPGKPRTSGGLSFQDLREIGKHGFDIGGHTVNHSNLSKIRDRVKMKHEIIDDKIRLEEIT